MIHLGYDKINIIYRRRKILEWPNEVRVEYHLIPNFLHPENQFDIDIINNSDNSFNFLMLLVHDDKLIKARTFSIIFSNFSGNVRIATDYD
jgi:hypothetical protein